MAWPKFTFWLWFIIVNQTIAVTWAILIYRRMKHLRVVQLLLKHTKLESTIQYLRIRVDDALEMASNRGLMGMDREVAIYSGHFRANSWPSIKRAK